MLEWKDPKRKIDYGWDGEVLRIDMGQGRVREVGPDDIDHVSWIEALGVRQLRIFLTKAASLRDEFRGQLFRNGLTVTAVHAWGGGRHTEVERLHNEIQQRLERFQAIGARLPSLLARDALPPRTDPATPGITHHAALRLGEVMRHFDQKTFGSIQGFMLSEFGFHGWGGGLRVGSMSVGLGQLGASGVSTLQLGVSTTARADLLGEALVAVFEEQTDSGLLDTIRVVAPSEEATHELVGETVMSIVARMGADRFDERQMRRMLDECRRKVTTEVSYVSDRLTAVLRGDSSTARFGIVGMPLAPHTLLGGAIQLDAGGEWHQLFPLAFMHELAGDGGSANG